MIRGCGGSMMITSLSRIFSWSAFVASFFSSSLSVNRITESGIDLSLSLEDDSESESLVTGMSSNGHLVLRAAI